MSRLEEFLSKVPVVTRILIVLNCAIHVTIFLSSFGINTLAINAAAVLLHREYYRIVSSAFVHGGFLHIFMNMSSLVQLGGSLEAQFGSMQFAFLTMWSILLVGALYVLFSWILAEVLNDPYQMHASAVGFSGVLFCYAVIDANHTFEVSRSMFGMFDVPAKLTPFVLLVLLQILIPNISMLGHLAGVIFGLFSVSSGITFLMPSNPFIEYIEMEVTPFSSASRLSSYIRHTDKSLVSSSAGEGINLLCTYTCNILALPLHIIGFPTERCCECLGKCLFMTTQAISDFFLFGHPELESDTLLPLPQHSSLATTSTTILNLPGTGGDRSITGTYICIYVNIYIYIYI
jgi:membrane associated rhomboid family serine protease